MAKLVVCGHAGVVMEPLLEPPVRPVDLGRRRIARARHDDESLSKTAHRLIFSRILGPADADRARITSETQLLLPFHRFELDAGGQALRVGSMRIGRTSVPLPFTQTRNEHVTVWVAAREEVPVQTQIRRRMAPLFDASTFGALDVPIAESTLDAETTLPIVESDVPRDSAEERAKLSALHSVAPQNAIFGVGGMGTVVSNYDVVLVPARVVRYHYRGQVLTEGGSFSVAVSAYSGKALWESHPPVVKSALGKFRRMLSFG